MPDLEYPTQSYWPGWKCVLSVRFDEFGKSKIVAEKAPKKITTKLKGTKDPRGTLDVIDDPEAPSGVKRFLIRSKASSVPGTSADQVKSQDNFTHDVGGIIPKHVTLGLNGIRIADTLTVEMKFLDMPIDPRTIRSCAIRFYLGTVTADEYQRGMAGQTRGSALGAGVSNAGDPLNLVADEYLGPDGKQRSNLRFEGFVDEWECEWPEDGEPVVRLQCRDNTSLLIEQDAPPKLVIDGKIPIDKAIATYMSNFPQMEGLTVEYQPQGVDPPKVNDSMTKGSGKPGQGPTPAKGGVDSKLSVWDYITDVCGALGHTVRLEGTSVIVQRARTIYGSTFLRPDDPYVPRKLSSGLRLPVRTMIFGRNVASMKIARKFTKTTPQNIEVRCYDYGRKQPLVARFPEQGERVTGIANPGDGASEQKWFTWRVTGVRDKKTLRIIAQGVYEQIARGELSVNVRTKNLASFGGGNEDPDLLDMKAGDSFELLTNRDDVDISSTTSIEDALLTNTEALLSHIGFDGAFAKAYSKAYSDGGFQTRFRVKSMNVDCDAEDPSVSFDIVAVNYLEIRNDKLLPEGEELTSADAQKAGK